jgi:mRNA-degrading endonuclease toxin of MazEF toxin-antitoxin module
MRSFRVASVVNSDIILTIARDRFRWRVAALSERRMAEACPVLQAATGSCERP